MTPPRHAVVRDQLEEYVLGYLLADERSRVEEHLAECAECSADLRDLTAVAEDLARTVDPVTPAPELKARVLAALAETPQDAGAAAAARPVPAAVHSRWSPAWLAAAAALVLVLGGMLYLSSTRARELAGDLAEVRRQQVETQARLQSFAGQADRVTAILTASDMRPIPLAAPQGATSAVARAYWSPSQGLLLVADELPEPPPGRVYQVWLIGGGASPVSAGLLGDDRSRRGMLLVPPPATLGGVTNVTVAVTDEPPGGGSAPTGSMRLVGSL